MSKFEARIAGELELELKAGKYVAIEYQYKIPLYVYLPDGKKAQLFNYICDFRCEKPDGSFVLIEAKGHITDAYRTKRKILDLVWLPDHKNYEFQEVRMK
jgi:hypothetical protein